MCVQLRFTELMHEKADLKERLEELEHRCIQLSGETDTIGMSRQHQHRLELAQCLIYVGNRSPNSFWSWGPQAKAPPSPLCLLQLPYWARFSTSGLGFLGPHASHLTMGLVPQSCRHS